ncbi:hypothetical protein D3C71_1860740 [compost metagenome]
MPLLRNQAFGRWQAVTLQLRPCLPLSAGLGLLSGSVGGRAASSSEMMSEGRLPPTPRDGVAAKRSCILLGRAIRTTPRSGRCTR